MRRRIDLSVYLVTDPLLCGARGVEAVVAAAVAGGATVVQLRDKDAPDADVASLGRVLLRLLRPLGVPLIVNDRAAVARAIGADGLHVGQTDGEVRAAREAIGPDAILGLSVETAGHARTADPALVDYVGAGPVFATATKPGHAAPVGLDGLARIVAACPVPAVAIGGLDAASAGAAVRAGAAGVAVVSAICGASGPEAAAREIERQVREGRA